MGPGSPVPDLRFAASGRTMERGGEGRGADCNVLVRMIRHDRIKYLNKKIKIFYACFCCASVLKRQAV